jgi:hypothetical protein
MLPAAEPATSVRCKPNKGNGMSDQPAASPGDTPVSGQAARRKFLQDAGTAAVLAPAAALLLSAANASARIAPVPYNLDSTDTDDAPTRS